MIEGFLLEQKECFPGEENSWTGIWLTSVLEHPSSISAKACFA